MRGLLTFCIVLLPLAACASSRNGVEAQQVPSRGAAVESGDRDSPASKQLLPQRGKTSSRAHGFGAFSDFVP
jgi:hypothetical protein